jgi:TPR repeat protein
VPTASRTGKGEEELSIAERYLSGANGGRRDTAQASQWLWRSVAKHNDTAALLLAELYLQGDGVSKNCDQARMLLDSAARKGISGAGVRLRNLQAFGCQ